MAHLVTIKHSLFMIQFILAFVMLSQVAVIRTQPRIIVNFIMLEGAGVSIGLVSLNSDGIEAGSICSLVEDCHTWMIWRFLLCYFCCLSLSVLQCKVYPMYMYGFKIKLNK